MNLRIARISHLCTIFILGISPNLIAQTNNDNIEDRVEILEDTPIQSFTNGNSVQWNCVDEKLTGKCIKYHNDQWFYFIALDAPVQYINISNQKCRDIWGVQLVLIEGIPCQTETYQIKSCISLGTQDDMFVTLDNLEPGKEYLLNVDGYLHDFCHFKMELSLTPHGLPVVQTIQIEASSPVRQDTLNYFWITPDSLMQSVTSYALYRRKTNEFKFSLIKMFPARQDAHGEIRKEYEYVEILTGENQPWSYKLIASIGNTGNTVDEFSAQGLSKVKTRYKIYPEIDLKKNAKLEILLTDYVLGVTLENLSIEYFPRDFKPIYFDVTEYIELGVKRFHLEIKNLDTKELFRVEYEYSKEEGLKKVR
jgi:hypothetical protein